MVVVPNELAQSARERSHNKSFLTAVASIWEADYQPVELDLGVFVSTLRWDKER